MKLCEIYINKYGIVPIEADFGSSDSSCLSIYADQYFGKDGDSLYGVFWKTSDGYHATPLLKFLLDAANHPDKAHFLVIDEINDNVNYEALGGLVKMLQSEDAFDWDIVPPISLAEINGEIPQRIHIPQNVYVIGIKSTGDFLLDQGLLEQSIVIHLDISRDLTESIVKSDGESVGYMTGHANRDLIRFASSVVHMETSPTQKQDILKLSELMSRYSLKLDYRSLKQMATYGKVLSLLLPGCSDEDILDYQICGKILPMISRQDELPNGLLLDLRQILPDSSRANRRITQMLSNAKEKGRLVLYEN